MLKLKRVLEKIYKDKDLLFKLQNSKNVEDAAQICKEAKIDISGKSIKSELQMLQLMDNERLSMIGGGKMNFNGLKSLTMAALIPVMLVGGNDVALAGNVVPTMKGKSYYETHDMSRIISERFDYLSFSKKYSYPPTSLGPWRVMAYKKVEHDPRFKSVLMAETARQLDVYNMLRELATIGSEKKFIPMTADDPDFQFMYGIPTANKEFEEIVEGCRREWNMAHDYKKPISNSKEAVGRALRILGPAFADKDPFLNKRIKVIYDPIRKVYLIENANDVPPHDQCVERLVLDANGEILSICCKEEYLQNLV